MLIAKPFTGRVTFVCLFLIFLFQVTLAGQGEPEMRYNKRSEAPSFFRFPDQELLPISEFNTFNRSRLEMGVRDDFQMVDSHIDNQGHLHRKFQQTFDGIEVEGGIYSFHADGDRIYALSGDFFPGLNLSTSPTVGRTTALTKALDYIRASVYMWEDEQEEAMLKLTSGNPDATYAPVGELVIANDGQHFRPADFRLLWKFDIYAKEPFSRKFVYVDAHTGQVFQTINQLHDLDAVGTAQTKYSGTRTITTDSWSGQYRLRETGRGNGIETYDLNQTPNFFAAVDFLDSDNAWNNVNAQQDEIATDVHWGAEMFYDYFSVVHGRNSIDDNGYKLLSYVHYNSNTNDAYWDGQRMIIGDGVVYTPLASLDVVAHEFSHGWTAYASTLDSRNEPGSLNESFSDIFAVVIDYWARPADANWVIAEQVTVGGLGIRDLANPATHNKPDTYQGTDWDGTLANIHNNSTVPSHAFYLMVNGGSGTNDLGDNYSVSGIGITDAAMIAYKTNTDYLSVFSDFADARFYSIQSAIDLFGACSPQHIATTNAWYAVGVGGPFFATVTANFTSSNSNFCASPLTVEFFNTSIKQIPGTGILETGAPVQPRIRFILMLLPAPIM